MVVDTLCLPGSAVACPTQQTTGASAPLLAWSRDGMLHQAYAERGVAGMHIGDIIGVYFVHLLHKQPEGFPECGEGCAAALLQPQHPCRQAVAGCMATFPDSP